MKTATFALALASILFFAAGTVLASDPPNAPIRQKVVGIGGFFFKSENPKRLAQWYETNLGISPIPMSHDQKPWRQEAGVTAFAPFPKTSGYFGKPEQNWMINFRVTDLKAMVAQLRAAGISVEEAPGDPSGDFARLHDPEGNPIELWQPKPSG